MAPVMGKPLVEVIRGRGPGLEEEHVLALKADKCHSNGAFLSVDSIALFGLR
jgi:hypothetical protein